MKIKTIAKALACATALSVAVSSSAFAAAPTKMEATRSGSNVTVEYGGINGQMTLLAFDITAAYEALIDGAGAENTPYENQEIVYVTQEDAGSSKTFAVKDDWAPKTEGETKYLLVKVGGTDIDTPAAQVVLFDYQAGEEFKYGNVDGVDEDITATDVGIIISYILGNDVGWDKGSVEFAAANVDGVDEEVTAGDVGLIIGYILGNVDTFPADPDGDGKGIFTGTAAASIEELEEVVEPEEATEPEAETPAEDVEEVKSEEVTEEVENSEETAEETSEEETETEAEVEAEAEAE